MTCWNYTGKLQKRWICTNENTNLKEKVAITTLPAISISKLTVEKSYQ